MFQNIIDMILIHDVSSIIKNAIIKIVPNKYRRNTIRIIIKLVIGIQPSSNIHVGDHGAHYILYSSSLLQDQKDEIKHQDRCSHYLTSFHPS